MDSPRLLTQKPGLKTLRPIFFASSYRTMEGWTILLLLLVATVTNADNLDLDGNVVAKMMEGFVTVCLPTPRSAEHLLLIFVQGINISLALELTWSQYNNYSCKFQESIGDVGCTHSMYSWSLSTINASLVWKAKCNYILQPTHKATGGSIKSTTACTKVPWGTTECGSLWDVDDRSLLYAKPLNASWCIKHLDRDSNECLSACNNSFDCLLNCTQARSMYAPSWYGGKDKAYLKGKSPLWDCQMEIGCKNIDKKPLLWLYPLAQKALVRGCLCSNTSYSHTPNPVLICHKLP